MRKTAINPVTSDKDTELRARIAKLEHDIQRLNVESAELAAERDEYLELYEVAPVPAVTLDGAYAIRRINLAAAQLLGEAPIGLFDRSFRGLIAPSDRAAFVASLARASTANTVERFRVHLELPLLPAFPVHVWVRYSRNRGVFELHLLDLREREQAEAEARRLAESERVAREASAAKDKFIAVLSHELRAPLTPVLAAASALRAKPLPAPVREAFEMIERNVAAEARLIDDLLDVNRIVRNKMQVERRVCDAHGIVEDAISTLHADREAKSIGLEVELTARRHNANVDPLRLRQVFMNLLKNAIKFTPEGGHLRVLSWNNGDNLALEVEDNGVGIEAEAMHRLFEPFMEERNTSAAGGLGLGLAISKGLIELQDGKIWAHSRGPGHGSRFVVEIPTVTTQPVVAQRVVRPRSEPPPSSGDTPPRVLLVDDHEDTVQILCDLLTENGFTVETANSVKAAQEVDLEHVDVIVSDIGLPDGNGFELMRELRTKTNRPAIALTGFGMESDVKASEEAGFDLHLTKPIDIDRLLAALEGLSSRARHARESSSNEHSAPARSEPAHSEPSHPHP
jgi:signal transduction histidine kinase/ActR/RegA family two-component response regulator